MVSFFSVFSVFRGQISFRNAAFHLCDSCNSWLALVDKKQPTKENTAPYIRYLGWLTGLFPDFDFFFIKGVRKMAAELLQLKPGDRVIDAGCGSGGSFPFLEKKVGTDGEVVGIEISPLSAESARRRISKNRWRNVSVIVAPAQEANLEGTFDALLMFAAPDVFASPAAWQNLGPHLKPNARVAFFGAKLTRRRVGVVLNPILRTLYRLSFSTTPGPDLQPWDAVEAYIDGIEVREYFFGLMYLASGRVRPVH